MFAYWGFRASLGLRVHGIPWFSWGVEQSKTDSAGVLGMRWRSLQNLVLLSWSDSGGRNQKYIWWNMGSRASPPARTNSEETMSRCLLTLTPSHLLKIPPRTNPNFQDPGILRRLSDFWAFRGIESCLRAHLPPQQMGVFVGGIGPGSACFMLKSYRKNLLKWNRMPKMTDLFQDSVVARSRGYLGQDRG